MKKIIKIGFITLGAVFIVYNIIWAVYVNAKYSQYIKALGGSNDLEVDGYLYHVKTPNYLSFTGNLSVAESEKVSGKEENMMANIMIWPLLDGTYEVSALLGNTYTDKEAMSMHTDYYGIKLNESGRPDMNSEGVEETYLEHKELFEAGWSRVDLLYEKAYGMWGILEKDK